MTKTKVKFIDGIDEWQSKFKEACRNLEVKHLGFVFNEAPWFVVVSLMDQSDTTFSSFGRSIGSMTFPVTNVTPCQAAAAVLAYEQAIAK